MKKKYSRNTIDTYLDPHTITNFRIMFYMYILKSLKDDKLYIGSTNNLRKRLKEHNSGLNKSTKARLPFKLIYYEAYTCEEDARHREHSLKLRARALKQLLKRIKTSLAS